MHSAIFTNLFRIRPSAGSQTLESIRRNMAQLPAKLDAIPAVDIDTGRFKYVLIRVDMQNAETKEEHSKVIVRGYTWAAFHGDIYDKVQAELEATKSFDTECLGGGRIFHDPTKGTIMVYGYSQGFGLADHSVTTELLKARYPDYQSITWSNEATGLSCRAENGQPVDWFVLYKLPASSSSDGRAYLYRTSIDTINSTWIWSSKSIDSLASLPGQTLDPIYSFPDVERLLLMYNDEWPNGTSSETSAHAKGVVAMDGHSGFWLVHSVPRFPPSPAPGVNYTLPVTGLRYGQTMLCLSLGFGQADPIGQQLLFYRPFVYHWTEPNQQWIVPSLSAVARGDHITQPPWFHQTTIVSSNQLEFISFAKASQFGKDLYGDWMADVLRNNLYVESWTNGQGRPMPSLCHNRTFTVLNVKQVRLSDGRIFPSHKDHSKWAVSSRQQDPWVCIADINRMDSQRHRGGGSLCFRQPELWSDLTRAVDQVEGCPLSSVGVGKRKEKKKKRISMQKWHSTKRLTSA